VGMQGRLIVIVTAILGWLTAICGLGWWGAAREAKRLVWQLESERARSRALWAQLNSSGGLERPPLDNYEGDGWE
jgi:hypothetical protein